MSSVAEAKAEHPDATVREIANHFGTSLDAAHRALGVRNLNGSEIEHAAESDAEAGAEHPDATEDEIANECHVSQATVSRVLHSFLNGSEMNNTVDVGQADPLDRNLNGSEIGHAAESPGAEAKAERVREHKAKHPEATEREIAEAFNMSNGSVHSALAQELNGSEVEQAAESSVAEARAERVREHKAQHPEATEREIAEALGVPKTAVHDALGRFLNGSDSDQADESSVAEAKAEHPDATEREIAEALGGDYTQNLVHRALDLNLNGSEIDQGTELPEAESEDVDPPEPTKPETHHSRP